MVQGGEDHAGRPDPGTHSSKGSQTPSRLDLTSQFPIAPARQIAEVIARGKPLAALCTFTQTGISKPTAEARSLHSLLAGWIIEVLQPRCNTHHIHMSVHIAS
jgi:hypothetical protein